jgi:hypothetical protein
VIIVHGLRLNEVMGKNFKMLKIDSENAFHMVERMIFLQEANQHFPESHLHITEDLTEGSLLVSFQNQVFFSFIDELNLEHVSNHSLIDSIDDVLIIQQGSGSNTRRSSFSQGNDDSLVCFGVTGRVRVSLTTTLGGICACWKLCDVLGCCQLMRFANTHLTKK